MVSREFDDPIWSERAEILRKLFSGQLSIQSTAEELAIISLYPTENLGLTWHLYFVAARNFPQHHDKLVDVLDAMTRLPPPADDDIDDRTGGYGPDIWQMLPELGWEANDQWNAFEIPQDEDERRKATSGFYNINAFCARLKLSGLEPFSGYDVFGLWTMRSALERQRKDPPDVFIPAAEAWISVAGPQMYQWDREFEYGGNRGDPGRGGELWNGRHGFCRGRWCLWRRRFGEFAVDEALPEQVRSLAASAERRMKKIEVRAGD